MKIKTTRRSFIRSAVTAGGGIAASEYLRELASAAGANPRRLSSFDSRVRRVLARMTLAEKIGQMPQAEQNAMKEGDFEKYFPGSLFCGGSSDLSLSNEDMSAIMNLRNAGLTVVVVLVSGRPMIINEALNQANAFVAAWLPGTEGQGVADVLFGDYKPTGKLSCSWPRAMSQIPINIGDANYDPLFRYGYGLTYS